MFVQAEVRQSVDADVKKAKADSEIDVKELYYDIYEQVRSFAFSSLASCLLPFNMGLKMVLRQNTTGGFSRKEVLPLSGKVNTFLNFHA